MCPKKKEKRRVKNKRNKRDTRNKDTQDTVAVNVNSTVDIKIIEEEVHSLEGVLDQIINLIGHPGEEIEDLFVYTSMLLASDKLENNVKQSTIHKIEDFKEIFKLYSLKVGNKCKL